MPLHELRFVLPFSVEEYGYGYAYTRSKYRAIAPPNRSSTTLAQATLFAPASGAELPPTTPVPAIAAASSAPGAPAGLYVRYHHAFKGFLPAWALSLLGTPEVAVDGHAWDVYPRIAMRYDLPALGGGSGKIFLSFMHVDNDGGDQNNVFGLTPAQLAERKVFHIDICDDPAIKNDGQSGDPAADPAVFVSQPLPTSGHVADMVAASGCSSSSNNGSSKSNNNSAQTATESARVAVSGPQLPASAPVTPAATATESSGSHSSANISNGCSNSSINGSTAASVALAPRGPLTRGWRAALTSSNTNTSGNSADGGAGAKGPFMCVYVAIRCELSLPFPLSAFRVRAEDLTAGHVHAIVTELHRMAFVWVNEWYPKQLPPAVATSASTSASASARANTHPSSTCPNINITSDGEAESESESSNGVAVVVPAWGAAAAAAAGQLYAPELGTGGTGKGVPKMPARLGDTGAATAAGAAGAPAATATAAGKGGIVSRGLSSMRSRLQAKL
mgnify:CR=1 FL=1